MCTTKLERLDEIRMPGKHKFENEFLEMVFQLLQPVYTKLLDRTRLNHFDPAGSVNVTRIDPDGTTKLVRFRLIRIDPIASVNGTVPSESNQ